MTAQVEDVMTMLTRVAEATGLEAAYRHSCRGAVVATPFIIGGGLLFGPVGIFIGKCALLWKQEGGEIPE